MSANVPEPPKKPLNAYLKVQQKIRDENKAKGITLSLKDLAEQSKAAYEKLSDKERSKMQDQFNKEREQYQKKKQEYEDKYGKVVKEKKNSTSNKMDKKEIKNLQEEIKNLKIPEKPKKPMSSYFLFRGDVYDKVRQQNPQANLGELAKIIGTMYEKISDAEKAKYNERFLKDQEKYNKTIQDFNNKYKEQLEKEEKIMKKIRKLKKGSKSTNDIAATENKIEKKDNKKEQSVKPKEDARGKSKSKPEIQAETKPAGVKRKK